MKKFIIADEGLLNLAAIVVARDENEAAVKYYEVAAASGEQYGNQGIKMFTIGNITWNDSLQNMNTMTFRHYADLQDLHNAWIEDVLPINVWIKYAHSAIVV